MAIKKLKKQLKELSDLEKHEAQVKNMFTALSQRREQLVAQKIRMEQDNDFDNEDIEEVQSVIDYIDVRYTPVV